MEAQLLRAVTSVHKEGFSIPVPVADIIGLAMPPVCFTTPGNVVTPIVAGVLEKTRHVKSVPTGQKAIMITVYDITFPDLKTLIQGIYIHDLKGAKTKDTS